MSEDAEERDGTVADETSPEDVDGAEAEELADEDPAAAFEQAGQISGTHLRAAEYWEDILGDMEATAAEYEADGWETLQLHPGDVTPLAPTENDDRFGLDVLVPDDEFAELETLVEGEVGFDSYEAFRATADELVLLVVAMEDHDAEVAVLYPAYYDARDGREMLQAAERAGEMRTYVRTLSRDRIEFTHAEPANFAPAPDEAEGESDDSGVEE